MSQLPKFAVKTAGRKPKQTVEFNMSQQKVINAFIASLRNKYPQILSTKTLNSMWKDVQTGGRIVKDVKAPVKAKNAFFIYSELKRPKVTTLLTKVNLESVKAYLEKLADEDVIVDEKRGKALELKGTTIDKLLAKGITSRLVNRILSALWRKERSGKTKLSQDIQKQAKEAMARYLKDMAEYKALQ